MLIKGWVCPVCGATTYVERREFVREVINPISGGDSFVITRPTGLYECEGCSRIFGDPLKFNKNKL